MAHTRTWDETKPVGGVEAASTLDTIIQNLKTDIRERDRLEHNWNGSPSGPSTTYDGVHLEGSARLLTGLLAAIPANRGVTPIDGAGGNEDGRLYLSTDSGELFYSDGTNWLTAIKKISGSLSFTLARTFTSKTGGDQVYSSAAETAIASLTGIAVPGSPDGVKKYELSIFMPFTYTNGIVNARVRMGGAGGLGDAVLLNYQHLNAVSVPIYFAPMKFQITPAAADKITLSFQNTNAGATNTIAGAVTAPSWVLIQEVIA